MLAQDANVTVSLIAPMFRETRQTQAMTSQLLICNPSICRHEPDSIYVQFTLHFVVTSVFHQCTNPETRAESCLSVPIIQTQLAFQLPNGHQTSFMAETDLIQRRLALTLKWQYKFTSSETHRPINKVHIYIYISVVLFRSCWRRMQT